MKITINVTASDIKKGDRASRCECPIARATKRIVKKSVDVQVYSHFIKYYDITWNSFRFEHSDEVHNFINAFDNKRMKNVKAGQFEIDVPEQYLLKKYIPKKKSGN